ncbi:MAG: hypothetical protein AMXMBFR13_40430 [Phycisphaerae bacterium]
MKSARTLAWVLTAVVAGMSAGAMGQEPLRLVFDATHATVISGGKPVAAYRYAEVPFKPYLDKLFTPGGVNVLRDSPADHKHHHGLMFAAKVDGVNFWEENNEPGRQLHEALNDVLVMKEPDIQSGSFVELLPWLNPKGDAALMLEARHIQVLQGKDLDATLLIWDSGLSLPQEKKTASLSGTAYHGLGVRFVESMDKGGTFFNADGKTGVKATHAARARWTAYTAAANGKPVTVAMFDHPGNPRHPAVWFTMDDPFAYLSATLGLDKQPLALSADRPVLLRYAMGVWDGKADTAKVDALYRRWVELTQPPQAPEGAPRPAQPPAQR